MTKESEKNTSHPADSNTSDKDDSSGLGSDTERTDLQEQERESRRRIDREERSAKDDESSSVDNEQTRIQSVDSTNRLKKRNRQDEEEPRVSVTIEGEYSTVFERLDHPYAFQQSELDVVVKNLEETLFAVVKRGGGIRSEIYETTEFELEDPWEIRKYLTVLEMHNLVHQKEDEWMPSDYFESSS